MRAFAIQMAISPNTPLSSKARTKYREKLNDSLIFRINAETKPAKSETGTKAKNTSTAAKT